MKTTLDQWLVIATEYAILVIDAMALLIIAVGTIVAFISALRIMVSGTADADERKDVWLRYARSLVAGLTFQLAADIIESSITSGWESVGRLAAIALIRTFLNHFLERDLSEVVDRQRQRTKVSLDL
jgi:uncharacterized membrane protein